MSTRKCPSIRLDLILAHVGIYEVYEGLQGLACASLNQQKCGEPDER